MRSLLFTLAGLLQLAIACVLLIVAWQLPGSDEVEQSAERVEKASRAATRQVRKLNASLGKVRERQPRLLALSRSLEQQMKAIGPLQEKRLSGDGLASVSGAMGHIASGLDSLSDALAPESVDPLAKGLASTADYLEKTALPAAEKAAEGLEKATGPLKTDATRLAAWAKEKPLEIKAARVALEGLTKLEEGLERMLTVAKLENFQTIREGFDGMEQALDGGAAQIEKFSKFTIPKITVKGLRISVEENPLWPDAKTTSDGMRKGAAGCRAAAKEMETVNKELPKLRDSLGKGAKIVRTARLALDKTLTSNETIEPVLQRLPADLARLAETLPDVMTRLATMLREVSKLRDAAGALRKTQMGLEAAAVKLPALRENLQQSAKVLRQTRKQLDAALANRDEFEQTTARTVKAATQFTESLPGLVEELDDGLTQQQDSLGELGDRLEEVSDSVAPAARSTSQLLQTTRLLLVLVAVTVALHAVYLLFGRGRQ